MRTLACLFIGMGIGGMNCSNLFFWIPMGLGLFFLIMDYFNVEKKRR